MLQHQASAPQNHLLSSLSKADFGLLQPLLEHVALELRMPIEEPGKPIKYAYFPERGIISVVALTTSHQQTEAGVIGREGMTGIAVLMGDERSPHSTYVQVAGEGQRIGGDSLREAVLESASLQRSLLRFAQTFMVQTAQTSLANARGKVEERLARWLLMAHDRLDADEVPLTHEFLALMLGVRRAGVTVALNLLETQALVSAKRGVIVVKDRAGLEELANGLYGVPEAELRRLTGWKPIHKS